MKKCINIQLYLTLFAANIQQYSLLYKYLLYNSISRLLLTLIYGYPLIILHTYNRTDHPSHQRELSNVHPLASYDAIVSDYYYPTNY